MKRAILQAICWLLTFLWRFDFVVIVAAWGEGEYEAEFRCREGNAQNVAPCLKHAAESYERLS
jgi:hypothetical protein